VRLMPAGPPPQTVTRPGGPPPRQSVVSWSGLRSRNRQAACLLT
jgi:hypothetical protein